MDKKMGSAFKGLTKLSMFVGVITLFPTLAKAGIWSFSSVTGVENIANVTLNEAYIDETLAYQNNRARQVLKFSFDIPTIPDVRFSIEFDATSPTHLFDGPYNERAYLPEGESAVLCEEGTKNCVTVVNSFPTSGIRCPDYSMGLMFYMPENSYGWPPTGNIYRISLIQSR